MKSYFNDKEREARKASGVDDAACGALPVKVTIDDIFILFVFMCLFLFVLPHSLSTKC